MQETIRMEMLLDIKMRFVNYYFDDKKVEYLCIVRMYPSSVVTLWTSHLNPAAFIISGASLDSTGFRKVFNFWLRSWVRPGRTPIGPSAGGG